MHDLKIQQILVKHEVLTLQRNRIKNKVKVDKAEALLGKQEKKNNVHGAGRGDASNQMNFEREIQSAKFQSSKIPPQRNTLVHMCCASRFGAPFVAFRRQLLHLTLSAQRRCFPTWTATTFAIPRLPSHIHEIPSTFYHA